MRKLLALASILLLVLVACRPQVPRPVMAPPQPVIQPPVVQPPVAQPPAEAATQPSGQTSVKGGTENIPAEAKSEVVNAEMSGFAFSPNMIKIKVGDTVAWTNKDSAPHTVTSTGGPESFNSDTLQKGGSFEHKFTQPGTYTYKCSIHPSMTATVVVE